MVPNNVFIFFNPCADHKEFKIHVVMTKLQDNTKKVRSQAARQRTKAGVVAFLTSTPAALPTLKSQSAAVMARYHASWDAFYTTKAAIKQF